MFKLKKSKQNLLDVLETGEIKKSFMHHAIMGLLALTAMTVLLSLIAFTIMLLFSQNELRLLSHRLLSRFNDIEEIVVVTNFVNTLHSMQTVVDQYQILALIYSILSTICIGIGIYFLKVTSIRQKDLGDKAKNIEDIFGDLFAKDKFNTLSNALYSYCMSYRLYHCIEITVNNSNSIDNGKIECLVRIQTTVRECQELSKLMKGSKPTPSNRVSINTLGYAKTTLEALAKEKDSEEEFVRKIGQITEVIKGIMDDLSN